MQLSVGGGAMRVVSHLSNLGNIELPGYSASQKLECAVWADPIFDECGVGRQDYKKVWTSEVGGAEIRRESSVTWEPQKPTKGATSTAAATAAAVAAKSVVMGV